MNGHNLDSRPESLDARQRLLVHGKQRVHARPAPIGGVTTETGEREPMFAR